MREQLPYWIQMRLLEGEQFRVARRHDAKIKKMRKEGASKEAISDAEDSWGTDDIEFQDEIAKLQTRHLISLANKLYLPYPSPPKWQQSSFGGIHLTTEAMADLRSAIRRERKEMWEDRLRWLPIVTALTGLFGALIGLIAILGA